MPEPLPAHFAKERKEGTGQDDGRKSSAQDLSHHDASRVASAQGHYGGGSSAVVRVEVLPLLLLAFRLKKAWAGSG